MATNYFPKKSDSAPMIYAYEDKHDPNLKGILKVGYTTIGVQERVRQQYNIVRPGEPPYRILVEESAMRQDGTSFLDHDGLLEHSLYWCEGGDIWQRGS